MEDIRLIKLTLYGLIYTAKEKKLVLGVDAERDISQIRDMYEELVRFWDLDESLMERFDVKIENLGAE